LWFSEFCESSSLPTIYDCGFCLCQFNEINAFRDHEKNCIIRRLISETTASISFGNTTFCDGAKEKQTFLESLNLVSMSCAASVQEQRQDSSNKLVICDVIIIDDNDDCDEENASTHSNTVGYIMLILSPLYWQIAHCLTSVVWGIVFILHTGYLL